MGIPPHPLSHLRRRSRKQTPRLRSRTIPPHPRRSLRHLPLLHSHHRPNQRRPRPPANRRPGCPPPNPLGLRTQLLSPPPQPPKHLALYPPQFVLHLTISCARILLPARHQLAPVINANLLPAKVASAAFLTYVFISSLLSRYTLVAHELPLTYPTN